MSASRLSLYNGALRLLGETKLASLSENRAPRRHLDDAWTEGGAVDYCLEAGQWKFAMRSVQLDASTSIAPAFGLQYAFDIPADHKRLGGVFSDESMTQPFRDYREEGGYWYASIETLYVRYVSNDSDYGGDLSLWPQRFVLFVQAHLAAEVALAVTGDRTKMDDAITLRDKKFLPDALSNDAMQEATKRPPSGAWVSARRGGWMGENR